MKRIAYEEKRKNIKMLLIMTAVFITAIILLIQVDRFIRPTLKIVCKEECKALTAKILSDSIQKTLSENPYDYNDFAELVRDENGNVTAVETITGNVNRLQANLFKDVNKSLEESKDTEISVSLGTASGVWIFAGKGPSVPMRFLPIGNADVELVSCLESAGINQTCHKILIEINVHVAGAVPFCKTEADIKYEYLLAETVLIGNVPNGYAVFGK